MSPVSNWGIYSKYVTRVAISPCFAVPWVEEIVDSELEEVLTRMFEKNRTEVTGDGLKLLSFKSAGFLPLASLTALSMFEQS
jgi:hypothetical protein